MVLIDMRFFIHQTLFFSQPQEGYLDRDYEINPITDIQEFKLHEETFQKFMKKINKNLEHLGENAEVNILSLLAYCHIHWKYFYRFTLHWYFDELSIKQIKMLKVTSSLHGSDSKSNIKSESTLDDGSFLNTQVSIEDETFYSQKDLVASN